MNISREKLLKLQSSAFAGFAIFLTVSIIMVGLILTGPRVDHIPSRCRIYDTKTRKCILYLKNTQTSLPVSITLNCKQYDTTAKQCIRFSDRPYIFSIPASNLHSVLPYDYYNSVECKLIYRQGSVTGSEIISCYKERDGITVVAQLENDYNQFSDTHLKILLYRYIPPHLEEVIRIPVNFKMKTTECLSCMKKDELRKKFGTKHLESIPSDIEKMIEKAKTGD